MRDLPEQLSSVGDFLSDLIETTSHVVHLMDTQQRKFIASNFLHAQYIGVQSIKDVQGLTGCDLLAEDSLWQCKADVDTVSFYRWRKWRVRLNNKVEHQAKISKHPMSINSISINHDGFIRPDNMTKFPILDPGNKKVIAILNIGKDLTGQYDLFSLLKIYRHFYPIKIAMQLFLKYLKIATCFIEQPTIREMHLLLVMCVDPRYKYVSKTLALTRGTVEVYMSRLRIKLTTDVHNILIQLRKTFITGRELDEYTTFGANKAFQING